MFILKLKLKILLWIFIKLPISLFLVIIGAILTILWFTKDIGLGCIRSGLKIIAS